MHRTARPATRPDRFRLPLWIWLGIWIFVWTAIPVGLHGMVHGVVNGWHLALSIFFAINTLICGWEISLGLEIDEIARRFRDAHAPRETALGLFRTPLSPRDLASTRLWSRVWSVYAEYDPSYADRRSFGFAIDVGNGWSTLIPGLIFQAGMTFGFLSAPVLGLLGALLYYQKFYGTCLYFFSYLANRRYRGHRILDLIPMVGLTNAVWLIFPLAGLYVSARLILDRSFALLWS